MGQNHIAGRVSGPIGIQLRWLFSERDGDGIILEIDGVAGGRRRPRRPEQTTGRSPGPNRHGVNGNRRVVHPLNEQTYRPRAQN